MVSSGLLFKVVLHLKLKFKVSRSSKITDSYCDLQESKTANKYLLYFLIQA